MLSTQSLREQLDRYAAGAISAEALEEWLAAESWDMRRWAPKGVQHFVEAIQANFIEFGDGKLSPEELRNYLLLRCAQLQRAGEVTEQAKLRFAALSQTSQEQKLTVAVSEAITVEGSAVVAA